MKINNSFIKSRKFIVILSVTLILFVSIIVYSLLFGRFFPFSPVIIGFSENELTNVIVYIQNGTKYTDIAELKNIDTLVPVVEDFHSLKFKRKPRLFIFKDKSSYLNRSFSRARFCVFYNGDMVLSPRALKEAKRGEISLQIYLLHELSHSLLHQHSGIIRASQYPPWLLEGIAVYSSRQMGTSWYPSKEETYNYIRNGNFMPPDYFKTSKEYQVKLDVKYRNTFMYSEFACIVDYLVEKYGRDKLKTYMKKLLKNTNHEKAFREVYGIEFKECIRNFKKHVRENQISDIKE